RRSLLPADSFRRLRVELLLEGGVLPIQVLCGSLGLVHRGLGDLTSRRREPVGGLAREDDARDQGNTDEAEIEASLHRTSLGAALTGKLHPQPDGGSVRAELFALARRLALRHRGRRVPGGISFL